MTWHDISSIRFTIQIIRCPHPLAFCFLQLQFTTTEQNNSNHEQPTMKWPLAPSDPFVSTDLSSGKSPAVLSHRTSETFCKVFTSASNGSQWLFCHFQSLVSSLLHALLLPRSYTPWRVWQGWRQSSTQKVCGPAMHPGHWSSTYWAELPYFKRSEWLPNAKRLQFHEAEAFLTS
jgi:hypothetical protein